MAYTTIDNPKEHFDIKLYTGNAGTQSITGLDFSPDLTWIKHRTSASYEHMWFDSVRGVTKYIRSNTTAAEGTVSATLTSFDSNGFSLGNNNDVNGSSFPLVAWNWKSSDSTAVSNTDGDITSTVSANTTAGFSIVTYTGDGTAGQKIGHGLGTSLGLLITKNRDASAGWAASYASQVTGDSLGGLAEASFSTISATDAFANNGESVLATGNTSVFAIGSGVEMNTDGQKYVAYCFSERKGYSRIGTYKGNGSTNGTFVYTGFKPRFLFFRSTDTCHTVVVDSARNTLNVMDDSFYTDTAGEEINSIVDVDFLSNGFKWRGVLANETNVSGQTYVYYAIAENPFVSSEGAPTTAR